DGRAIDRKKRLVRRGALHVQSARDELLACPRFSGDEYGRPGAGYLGDERFDGANRRAITYQGGGVSLNVEMSSERLIFAEKPTQGDEPVDPYDQVVEEHGFHQVVVRAALEGRHGVFDRRVCSDHDEERFGSKL